MIKSNIFYLYTYVPIELNLTPLTSQVDGKIAQIIYAIHRDINNRAIEDPQVTRQNISLQMLESRSFVLTQTGLVASVALLKTDVAELKGDVAVLKTAVAELKTFVQTSTGALQEGINTLLAQRAAVVAAGGAGTAVAGGVEGGAGTAVAGGVEGGAGTAVAGGVEGGAGTAVAGGVEGGAGTAVAAGAGAAAGGGGTVDGRRIVTRYSSRSGKRIITQPPISAIQSIL